MRRGAHRAQGGATGVRRGALLVALSTLGTAAFHAEHARGDGAELAPPKPTASASASASAPPVVVPWSEGSAGDAREGLDPFPSTGHYLSYGFAFTSEALLATGNVCPKLASEGCVLGNGGGLAFNGALRTPVYSLGAAYEASFHDSNNIYQRGVLQQLRGEWRLHPQNWVLGESANPFVGAGAGLAMYGDNWRVATLGLVGHGIIGIEYDLGVKVAAVFGIAYRAMYFRSFTDASGQYRPAGLAHMLGLQLGLELHDPL